MGNWSERQEEKREGKEKEKTSRETLGKYFYDLSKLSFTALFLGGGVSLVLDFQNINYWVLVSFGAFTSFILSLIHI